MRLNHYSNEGVTPILMLPTILRDLSMLKNLKLFGMLQETSKEVLCKIQFIGLEILDVPTPKNVAACNKYYKMILSALKKYKYLSFILIFHFFFMLLEGQEW